MWNGILYWFLKLIINEIYHIIIYIYIYNDEIPGFLLCLKCDISISRSEDIDVAMATVISTNNKRAFRLRARPLLLPVISKWLQVIKTVCDFDLFLEREDDEHPRKISLGYWQWRWQVNWRRRKYKHEQKDADISAKNKPQWKENPRSKAPGGSDYPRRDRDVQLEFNIRSYFILD